MIWQEEHYKEYEKKLKERQDVSYRNFHKRLTETKYEILGIRVPICRKIAKEIAKTDVLAFLDRAPNNYYEEILIEGFVLETILEEEIFWAYFKRFLPKIDNWAICDSVCSSFKRIAKKREYYWPRIQVLLNQKEPFTIRVGLILLLDYYLLPTYLKKIENQLDRIKSNHYYVNMAMAWLLAEMYIKYPKETEEYIKTAKMNDFTINKTISKIRESNRISKEEKDRLLQYKRRRKNEEKNYN
ncbi:MAG: DNA alkylation repair protein [Bacilli bacterium]|jgi:3-methyladenine DNA glycosylase AlkD|nr:DNA alkylation repair protein [Bacilli bacterium]